MDLTVKAVEQLRDHLRSLRREAKLTQKTLGVRMGVGQVRVAEIESSPGSISTEQLLQVLQALGAEMVIRPKSSEKTELAATFTSTSKMTGALTVRPSVVSSEVAQVAQGRLRDLLQMSDEQAEQAVTDLVKWRGHPPDHDYDFPRAEPVVLDAQGAHELNYWRQALNIDEPTFLNALRAVGVVLVQDAPAQRNEGSW